MIIVLWFALLADVRAAEPCTASRFFKNLVRQEPGLKRGSVHTFVKTGQGDYWFWIEKKTLINPQLPTTAVSCDKPSLVINRRLTLEDGILPPGQEVDGSTYQVTHSWAAEAIYQGIMRGETVRVAKP
jgi:hypothetical protein